MKFGLMAGAIAASLLCLWPATVQASTIVYTVDLPIPVVGPYSRLNITKFSVPSFSTQSGILRSAEFRFDYDYADSITYDARTSPTNDQWFFRETVFDIGFIYNTDGFLDPVSGIADQVVFIPFDPGDFYSFEAFTLEPGTFGKENFIGRSTQYARTVSPSDLIGLSILPEVYLDFTSRRFAYVERLGDPGLQVYDISLSQSARLTITYDYSVPEPSTWALMILGFGLVGFAKRRQQYARMTVFVDPTE